MSDAAHKAVFLSYASQDAEAAKRICGALRAAGVEVWFDVDGGLEHGDEWDAKIRRQIKECVLFLPVISAHTQARHEGYFRIEWELAAERAMGIAGGVAFILPIVIDDTCEPDALVPDRFRRVQWTRLRGGDVPEEVRQRFARLWAQRIGAQELKVTQTSQSRPPGFGATRGLAAILFTDVVGYSARMQRDEKGTLALVEADFALMRERCVTHEGEVLNSMGDGLLMCFPSAVQAVSCALLIQAEFGCRREKLPADQTLEHRMGVHIGDVIRQDSGVAGDGVNIAARLEGKAPPGGVCISQIVHDTVQGKVPMQSVFLGPESFKNITNPIPVWHIAPEGGGVLSRPPRAARTKARPAASAVRWLWRGVMAALVLGALAGGGYRGYRWYYQRQEAAVLAALNMAPAEPVKKEGRVLVARLENRSGNAALDRVGQMVADHVRRRAPELEWIDTATAIPEAKRLKPEATAAEMRALAQEAGGDLLVTGDYYVDAGKLFLTGRIFDLQRGRVVAELAPRTGDSAAVTAVVEDTAERLLGAMASVPRVRSGREDVTKFVNFSRPRRLDAVQLLDRGSGDDLARYRRSYERDPEGSLSSLVLLAVRQVFDRHYAEADAVLAEVEVAPARGQLTPYVTEMMHWVRATTGGDADGVEQALDTICRWTPSNRAWRAERIYALYRANKPHAILREFEAITPGSPGESASVVWYARAVAYFLLQDFPAMEQAGRRALALSPKSDQAMEWVACGATFGGNFAEVRRMLDAYDGVKEKNRDIINPFVAVLAVLKRTGRGGSAEFAEFLHRGDEWFASRPASEASSEIRFAQAELHYVAGRYAEARAAAERLLQESPDDLRLRAFAATVAVRLGDRSAGEAALAWLRTANPQYRFGYPAFAQAKLAALLGQTDTALRFLREAFAQHSTAMLDFSWEGLLLSPDFDSLRDDPRFREFIAPRG